MCWFKKQMTTSELRKYLTTMCQLEKFGGRFLQEEADLVLLDLPCWTDDMATCVRHRFPGLSSLSKVIRLIGFEVIRLMGFEGIHLIECI